MGNRATLGEFSEEQRGAGMRTTRRISSKDTLRAGKFNKGVTLLFSFALNSFSFNLMRGNLFRAYWRLSLGFLKIHFILGDMDWFFGEVIFDFSEMSSQEVVSIPKEILERFIHTQKGLGLMVGVGESIDGFYKEVSSNGLLRIAWRWFFIHIGFVDLDRLWSGVLAMSKYMRKASKFREQMKIFKKEGLDELMGR